jgi:hypothetical protein
VDFFAVMAACTLKACIEIDAFTTGVVHQVREKIGQDKLSFVIIITAFLSDGVSADSLRGPLGTVGICREPGATGFELPDTAVKPAGIAFRGISVRPFMVPASGKVWIGAVRTQTDPNGRSNIDVVGTVTGGATQAPPISRFIFICAHDAPHALIAPRLRASAA